jgi:zinc transport system substrate-binding protein
VSEGEQGKAVSPTRPLLILLALVLLVAACGGGEEHGAADRSAPAQGGRPRVYAVNHPLEYFARRIGGESIAVHFPAPPQVDPAFWSPAAETVAAYQSADLILLNGFGYAKWVERASLPRKRQIDTSAGFRNRAIPLEDKVTHTHGPKGDHSHKGLAFTTWLDPLLALEQARAVEQALAAMRPDQAARFEAGFAALEADLLELDAALADAAAQLDDAPILFSHPVYQYLERRYALNGRSLHWEPDATPSESQWSELAELLAQHPAGWMIWESEPLPEVKRRLEARGVRSAVFSPAAKRPDEGDFFSVMQANAKALARIAESP